MEYVEGDLADSSHGTVGRDQNLRTAMSPIGSTTARETITFGVETEDGGAIEERMGALDSATQFELRRDERSRRRNDGKGMETDPWGRDANACLETASAVLLPSDSRMPV